MRVLWTAKSWRPDTPTLVSSLWRSPQATEATSPALRGDHEGNR